MISSSRSLYILAIVLAFSSANCLPPSSSGTSKRITEEGNASYYADSFEGRRTANGETYAAAERTAAHRTFPFGTLLRVVNLTNGLATDVRVNDRGPFKDSRVIDLSRKAAEDLDLIRAGVARVRIEVLQWGE